MELDKCAMTTTIKSVYHYSLCRSLQSHKHRATERHATEWSNATPTYAEAKTYTLTDSYDGCSEVK